MTINLPKDKWLQFFNDLNKRRFGWRTKIEVMSDSIGDQVLSENLFLNGITISEKGEDISIEIAVSKNTAHQSHNILNPSKVAFLSDGEKSGEIVEIEESNGTKTLVHIIGPVSLIVSYSEFEARTNAA